MVLATLMMKGNWRNSWRILQRDRKKMASINAGWTIPTMAGALNIQLEKPGFYTIGDNNNLSPTHITKALQIMLLTAILFALIIVTPIIITKAVIAPELFAIIKPTVLTL
jgi:adenosylcobinamide-phosphate synthase